MLKKELEKSKKQIETSNRFEMLILKLQSQGIITESKSNQLLNKYDKRIEK